MEVTEMKKIAVIISIVIVFTFSSCMIKKPFNETVGVSKTELIPGIEVTEKDASRTVDGKKILDFSKLFSGTLRTSITFDEFYTIIEYSEKLMSEYDKIDLDSDSLNVRIKDFANNMYDDKMSTVKIDINNLSSVTHVDMLSYQFAVCKLVKNILFRICDSSMYMILREDSAKADLINNIIIFSK